jgi:hypothetical protein
VRLKHAEVQYKRDEQTRTVLSRAVGSKPKQFLVNELAKIVDGKPGGNRPSGKFSSDGETILKRILKEFGVRCGPD